MRALKLRQFGLITCLGAGFAVGHPPLASAADAPPPPQATSDGLQLQKSTKTRLVYVKPGATLAPYKRVAILDCYVEFEKNWQKDYNQSKVSLDGRVTDKDVEKMKAALAAAFKKVFTGRTAEER